MAFEPDLVIERRRLRRRASVWRFAAIVAGIVVVIAALGGRDGLKNLIPRPYVARVDVSGVITDDSDFNEKLTDLSKDDSAKALIVRIDSPGGTTVGAETLFRALRLVAEHKPVVAVMGSLAASGGYIAALGADHIVADGNTLTGSIGVLFEAPNIEGLMGKVGVQMEQITSGPLKGEPNPFHALKPEARVVMQGLIQDSYEWFVGLVAERRGIPLDRARTLGDGRVYSGRQALANKLIDEIGDERTARAWLAKAKGVPESLPVREVKKDDDNGFGSKLGSHALAMLIGSIIPDKRLMLDGLVSVWHAPR